VGPEVRHARRRRAPPCNRSTNPGASTAVRIAASASASISMVATGGARSRAAPIETREMCGGSSAWSHHARRSAFGQAACDSAVYPPLPSTRHSALIDPFMR
jgi:hypothetical protein